MQATSPPHDGEVTVDSCDLLSEDFCLYGLCAPPRSNCIIWPMLKESGCNSYVLPFQSPCFWKTLFLMVCIIRLFLIGNYLDWDFRHISPSPNTFLVGYWLNAVTILKTANRSHIRLFLLIVSYSGSIHDLTLVRPLTLATDNPIQEQAASAEVTRSGLPLPVGTDHPTNERFKSTPDRSK